jgi:hypothetical protein
MGTFILPVSSSYKNYASYMANELNSCVTDGHRR